MTSRSNYEIIASHPGYPPGTENNDEHQAALERIRDLGVGEMSRIECRVLFTHLVARMLDNGHKIPDIFDGLEFTEWMLEAGADGWTEENIG